MEGWPRLQHRTHNPQDEERSGNECTAPETSRFENESMQPLQAYASNPSRRVRHPVCIEIEDSTNGRSAFRPAYRHQLLEEYFLLRRAQSNPQHIRFELENHPRQSRNFSSIKVCPVRRTVPTNFGNSRVFHAIFRD